MVAILRKEIRLCLNPHIIIMALLSLLVIIPDWPSGVAFIYLLSGVATIFPRVLADHDVLYTAMLPIRKTDVVKGKVALISFVELSAIVLSIPAALVRIFVLQPAMLGSYANEAERAEEMAYLASVEPNLMAYGTIFFSLGVYALVLLPWFFGNPSKVNWPQAIATLSGSLALALGMGLQAFITMLKGHILSDDQYMLAQVIFLLVGVAFYSVATLMAAKWAAKRFAKVDL
jgi:hypothetical protein